MSNSYFILFKSIQILNYIIIGNAFFAIAANGRLYVLFVLAELAEQCCVTTQRSGYWGAVLAFTVHHKTIWKLQKSLFKLPVIGMTQIPIAIGT